MGAPLITLKNSELKGFSTLLLGSDINELQKLESLSEIDPSLSRFTLYTTNSINEARDYAKKYNIDLCVYEEIEDQDFVSIQVEIRASNPNTYLVPLLEIPSIPQLRESKKIGGVIDFESPNIIYNISNLTNLIINTRDNIENERKNQDIQGLEGFKTALEITDFNWAQKKVITAEIINSLLPAYDISSSQKRLIFNADQVFSEKITSQDYAKHLSNVSSSTKNLLIEAAPSFSRDSKSPPSSLEVFIIRVANLTAELILNGMNEDQIIQEISKLPTNIRHVAFRTIKGAPLLAAIQKATQISIKRRAA